MHTYRLAVDDASPHDAIHSDQAERAVRTKIEIGTDLTQGVGRDDCGNGTGKGAVVSEQLARDDDGRAIAELRVERLAEEQFVGRTFPLSPEVFPVGEILAGGHGARCGDDVGRGDGIAIPVEDHEPVFEVGPGRCVVQPSLEFVGRFRLLIGAPKQPKGRVDTLKDVRVGLIDNADEVVGRPCRIGEGIAAVEGLCSEVITDEQKGADERYVSLSE